MEAVNNTRPYTAAIIAAGGSSQRMGSEKLKLDLDGEPVLIRTLEVFEACDAVDEIILVTRADLMAETEQTVRAHGLIKVKRVVAGGSTRTESVKNGAAAVSAGTQLLCIHDGARPLVTDEAIRRVLAAAWESGAATAAVPCKNTIKSADGDGFVLATLPRETLWEIQTPQCFVRTLYDEAVRQAGGELFTDDCALVERMGKPVRLVQGDRHNIKLTTPEDLAVARAFRKEMQK